MWSRKELTWRLKEPSLSAKLVIPLLLLDMVDAVVEKYWADEVGRTLKGVIVLARKYARCLAGSMQGGDGGSACSNHKTIYTGMRAIASLNNRRRNQEGLGVISGN